MRLRNSRHRYGAVARLLHWSSVALVLTLYIGISGIDRPPKNLDRDAVIAFHAGVGLVLFVLMALRLGWRTWNPNPVASYTLARGHRRVVYAVHRTLYVLVLSQCALGILALGSGEVELPLFEHGRVALTLPAEVAWREAARALHDAVARVLLVLIAVHATAAVLNQIFGVVELPTRRP